MTERKHDHNSNVTYVDSHGVAHAALVTAWWNTEGANWDQSTEVRGTPRTDLDHPPGCNLLFMSKDRTKEDGYGRQLERATSVMHKSNQVAAGNYWCWPDELPVSST